MLVQIATVVAPVFIIVALGYSWARWHQPFDSETLTNLVIKLATPCLIFSTLTSLNIELEAVGKMAMIAVYSLGLSAIAGFVFLKFSGMSVQTYLASIMHANSGNIGLPLVFMAFGDEGLALGVSYFVVNSISQYTIGFGIAAGSINLVNILKQPLYYAVVLSVLTLWLEIPVPEGIAKTTELLGNMVIPALLMVLGHSLSQLKITDMRTSMLLAGFRLVIGVSLGFLLVFAFDLEGTQAGVVFLMLCMPVAVFNFVFAKHFGRSPEKVAGVVVFSTVLVFTLLPGFVWISLWLARL